MSDDLPHGGGAGALGEAPAGVCLHTAGERHVHHAHRARQLQTQTRVNMADMLKTILNTI